MTNLSLNNRFNNKWLVAIIATSAAFIEVMDMTIISVSLHKMRGELSVTNIQITWLISAYIISAAVITPISGYLIQRFGRKQLLILSLFTFMLSSGACGLTSSFSLIILFRILQGLSGAPLAPIAQSLMVDTFTGNDRNKAMALFSMGIMTAPLIGPILGGYITDYLSWRFCFFINVPICLLLCYLAKQAMVETEIIEGKVNWISLLLIVLSILTLQFVLEEGNRYDWFSSIIIINAIIISVLCFCNYIIHAYKSQNAIIPLILFCDCSFVIALILSVIYGIGFYGSMSLLPMQLESIVGYPAISVGWMLAPRGLASVICMIFVPRLLKLIDPYILIIMSFILFSLGSYSLSLQCSININTSAIVYATVIQGVSTALFFVPLSVIAYKTIDRKLFYQASGVFNFMRSIGGSIGVSLSTLIYERLTQSHWNLLIPHVTGSAIRLFHPYVIHLSGKPDRIEITEKLHRIIEIQANTAAYANSYFMLSEIFMFGAFMTTIAYIYNKWWINHE